MLSHMSGIRNCLSSFGEVLSVKQFVVTFMPFLPATSHHRVFLMFCSIHKISFLCL